MQNTYKILSLLLDYPNSELKDNLGEVIEVINEENILNDAETGKLRAFLKFADALTLSEWQTLYVQLFDFSTRNNLYLFDHIYGDSRERGQAMVDLTEMYNNSGFTPSSNELPDYLPLFLEYLSLLDDPEQTRRLLKEVAHIITNIRKQLEKRETPYSLLIEIIEKKGTEV